MKNLKKLIFPILFFISLLFIFEIGLRIYGVQPGTYITNRFHPYDFDPELGWVTKPSSTYLRISPDYMHYNYYNPQGYPSAFDDREKQISNDNEKIVLIGNSFVEGYYVPYEHSIPQLLQKKINREVLNLGVSGYTPEQYLLQARKHLPKFKYDKIFVFYYPYQDAFFLGKRFYFGGYEKPVLDESTKNQLNAPIIKKEKSEKYVIEDYSSLVTFLQPVTARISATFGISRKRQIKTPRLMFNDEMQTRALKVIRQIQEEFRPRNGLHVIYLPSVYEFKESPGVLKSNLEIYQDVCRKIELDCSMPEVFMKEPMEKIFFVQDAHPSPYGVDKILEHLLPLTGITKR